MRGKITYNRDGSRAYYLDDKEVTEKEFEAAFPPKPFGAPELANNTSSCWPMVSEALAVHPEQVAEANARNKKHGIAARYDEGGFCHIPDRSDRKKLLKLEGLVDKNS